jgi:hypothetical protein
MIITALVALGAVARAEEGRKTISLDGTWQIAEGIVRCTVREVKTPRLVGSADSRKFSWKPGEQQTIELALPIENCRLWTPEDPFLYELEVSVLAGPTATDTLNTRFGMRSFSFAPKTKLPLLNGKGLSRCGFLATARLSPRRRRTVRWRHWGVRSSRLS